MPPKKADIDEIIPNDDLEVARKHIKNIIAEFPQLDIREYECTEIHDRLVVKIEICTIIINKSGVKFVYQWNTEKHYFETCGDLRKIITDYAN